MGLATFLFPDHLTELSSRTLLQTHYVTPYELVPVPTRTTIKANQLILEKDNNESSYVEVDWPLGQRGLVRLRTATLIERPQPYFLLQELCRGKLNQIRTRLAEWQAEGYTAEINLTQRLRQLVRQFNTSLDDPLGTASVQLANGILANAIELGNELMEKVAVSWQCSENDDAERSGCLTEIALDAIPQTALWNETLKSTASVLRIIPSWSRIEPSEYGYDWVEFDRLMEWAEKTNLPLTIGPIIDFVNQELPDWLTQWDGDLATLAAYGCDFAETLIRRYQATNATWQVFHGLNHTDTLGLNEDDRLQLAARLLDACRRTLPLGEWSIGIEQPWGDYLSDDQYTYSPFIFVDTLIRAGFYLNGIYIGLESALNPNSSQTRTPIDILGLYDQFQELGISLRVVLFEDDIQPIKEYTKQSLQTLLKLSAALPYIEMVCIPAALLSENTTQLTKILKETFSPENKPQD